MYQVAGSPRRALTSFLIPLRVCGSQQGHEAVERDLLEADWARAGLEREDGGAAATLRHILAAAPPSPNFVPYYDAYLQL
jgi:hypothetical protein